MIENKKEEDRLMVSQWFETPAWLKQVMRMADKITRSLNKRKDFEVYKLYAPRRAPAWLNLVRRLPDEQVTRSLELWGFESCLREPKIPPPAFFPISLGLKEHPALP